jgi:hypothetical protein
MLLKSATWALALSLLSLSPHPTTAMNGGLLRKFSELAEMGLDADEQPLHSESGSQPADLQILSEPEPPIEPEYVELPKDHFAENQNYDFWGMFWNRYWVRDKAYRPGGPVFVYDAGETDAGLTADFRLRNETSFFRQLVDRFHGIGIVWEHRYCMFQLPLFSII